MESVFWYKYINQEIYQKLNILTVQSCTLGQLPSWLSQNVEQRPLVYSRRWRCLLCQSEKFGVCVVQTAFVVYIFAIAFEHFANVIATIKKANHEGQLPQKSIPSDVEVMGPQLPWLLFVYKGIISKRINFINQIKIRSQNYSASDFLLSLFLGRQTIVPS